MFQITDQNLDRAVLRIKHRVWKKQSTVPANIRLNHVVGTRTLPPIVYRLTSIFQCSVLRLILPQCTSTLQSASLDSRNRVTGRGPQPPFPITNRLRGLRVRRAIGYYDPRLPFV